MDRFCSRCGTRVADDTAQDCPNCHAPLSVTTDAPAPAASPVAGCTVCGRPAPAEQLIAYRDQRVCPECKPAFFQKLREGVSGGQAAIPQEPAIPFEAAPGIGSFFATLKAFITAPLMTMRGQRTGEGFEAAIAFWLIINIPAQFLSRIVAWGIQNIMPNQPQPQLPPGASPEMQRFMDIMQSLQHLSLPINLGIAAGAIIFGLIWQFIFAGLVQVLLRLFGGGSQGYKSTFKALCYAITPMVFLLVPCCGGCIAWVWILVLHLILVGAAHRESVGRGAGAVAVAWFISCMCLGVLYMVIGVAFFASISSRLH